MNIEDFKIYSANLVALFITFSSADHFLKFCLTGVVMGYTVHKWYFMHVDRKEKKDNEKNKQDEKED